MDPVTVCLWFDMNAEAAVELYQQIFDNVTVHEIARYGEGGPAPAGTALTIDVTIEGQRLTFLNGGPEFPLSAAVRCDSQDEVDRYYDALLAAGGEEQQCGWVSDRFGLCWQIVPKRLPELLGSSDPGVGERVMAAMLQMKKLDIAALEAAARG